MIDLDPDSDNDGLSGVVVPGLEERRHVSVFGENSGEVSPASATNWLMANGWKSHDEQAAEDDDQWRRRGYLQRVRQLIDDTHDGTPHQSAAVLVLRSGNRDREIDRVLDYIDERYDGIAERLDLAEAPAVNGIDIDAFLTVVAESLPPDAGAASPSLPGPAGRRWALKWSDLQRLSVDLEVLHSEILSSGDPAAEQVTDEFWRGRPPTWQELEVPVDVERDAYKDLANDIIERLNDHQLATVRLDHSPARAARRWPVASPGICTVPIRPYCCARTRTPRQTASTRSTRKRAPRRSSSRNRPYSPSTTATSWSTRWPNAIPGPSCCG